MQFILRLAFIFMIAHAVITASLANVGINAGAASNLMSILPYLTIFTYWLIKTYYQKKFSCNGTLLLLVIYFCTPLLLSFTMSAYSFGFVPGFAIVKTYYLPFLLLLIFYDVFQTKESIYRYNTFLRSCLLFICIFTLFETASRLVIPGVYERYLSFMAPANKNVLEHIVISDSAIAMLLDDGARQALLPLGIFFDMQTQATLAMILGLWALSEKKYKIAVLAACALLASMRLTQIVSFLWGSIVLYFGYYSLAILPVFGMGILLIAQENIGLKIILEHLADNLYIILNSDTFALLFGRPADQMLEVGSEILGYNEVYVYRYVFYFGMLALFVLSSFMLILCASYTRNSKNLFVPSRFGLALGFNMPILVFHYNLLFSTIILFLYMYFFFIGWSSKYNHFIKTDLFDDKRKTA